MHPAILNQGCVESNTEEAFIRSVYQIVGADHYVGHVALLSC